MVVSLPDLILGTTTHWSFSILEVKFTAGDIIAVLLSYLAPRPVFCRPPEHILYMYYTVHILSYWDIYCKYVFSAYTVHEICGSVIWDKQWVGWELNLSSIQTQRKVLLVGEGVTDQKAKYLVYWKRKQFILIMYHECFVPLLSPINLAVCLNMTVFFASLLTVLSSVSSKDPYYIIVQIVFLSYIILQMHKKYFHLPDFHLPRCILFL